MSALECLTYQAFASSTTDASPMIDGGRAGVPRYDGDPTTLAEYAFRVRLLEARFANMDETERKKQGPLGLKLVEGLSGGALQVVRELSLDKLATEKGPTELIEYLYQAFRPRRAQEARDLYAAGAQVHGVLSRQSAEPMTSYLLRRKTWYRMLLDLDSELKLPEAILAEQTLVSAGITRDHQLMVRTALQGKMDVASVCNELIAQHSRIHEQERRGWNAKGSNKGSSKGKSYGKYGYYVDSYGYNTEEYETHSQSLGGYEAEESPASAYNAAEHYEPDYMEEQTEEEPYTETLAALLSEGLDEQNQEAVEYAAEILQIDAEAYYIHQKAQQAGHTGFGRDKGYGKGKSKMSSEDRKARIDAIKRKTTCRKCGQMGHWSTDYACPKNRGKGGPKGSGGTTTSTASTATSQRGGRGSGKPAKPRTFYFVVNEYKTAEHETVEEIEEPKAYVVRGYHQVPPPDNVREGEVVRTPTEGVLVESPTEGSSADELLDAAIAQAQRRRAQQLQEQQRATPLQLTAGSSAGPVHSNAMHTMVPVPEDNDFDMMEYLVNTDEENLPMVPALPERFNAFGGPQPRTGEERGPEATPSPLFSGEVTPEACEHRRTTRQGTNGRQEKITCLDCHKVLSITKKEQVKKMETQERKTCKHENRHFRGTTGTTWKWTCDDCGHSETGNKNPGETGRQAAERASTTSSASRPLSSSTPPPPSTARGVADEGQAEEVVALMKNYLAIQREAGNPVSERHLDIAYDKCKSLVYEPGRYPHIHAAIARPVAAPSTPTSRSRSARPAPTPTTPARSEVRSEASYRSVASSGMEAREITVENIEEYEHEIVQSGKHAGKTFEWVCINDNQYCKFIYGKYNAGDLRCNSLKELAQYAHNRPPTSAKAFMAIKKDEIEEDCMVAVIDTGCNLTCHGSQWMEEYLRATGMDIPLKPCDGKFNGVGGKIKVKGLRTIPVTFSLEDGSEAQGVITSTELEGSHAPLLLSTKAQKSLGLMIDMSERKVYSKTMKQHLEIVDRDGLPGIRLLPGDHGGDAIALQAEECDASEEEAEEEISVVTDKTKIEEEDTMGYIKLDDGSLKQMTKGQKKMLGDTIEELEKEDQAMWTTLREKSKPTKNPGRLLPRGCGVALMELFSGAATLSLMVATLGLPVAEPIDILNNADYDLLRPEVRRMVESRIEVEDPLLLSMAPVCGPWSPLQNLNEMREGYADNLYAIRQQWYPVVKWLTELIRKRLNKGREVMLENPCHQGSGR